jgi:lysophospholipase L1-like esterase
MTYALFGDSQAEGLAPHLERLLGDELVLVDARRGIGTRAFIDNAMLVAPRRVDVAIVVLGGNDTASSSYPETLRAAAHAFSTLSSKIVWIGPSHSEDPEVERRHAAAREVQARVLPSLVASWYDPTGWQVGAAGEHTSDGTHFTRGAYAEQATEIVDRLRSWNWPLIFGLAAGVALSGGIGYALAKR